jgi:hypothetical protein
VISRNFSRSLVNVVSRNLVNVVVQVCVLAVSVGGKVDVRIWVSRHWWHSQDGKVESMACVALGVCRQVGNVAVILSVTEFTIGLALILVICVAKGMEERNAFRGRFGLNILLTLNRLLILILRLRLITVRTIIRIAPGAQLTHHQSDLIILWNIPMFSTNFSIIGRGVIIGAGVITSIFTILTETL